MFRVNGFYGHIASIRLNSALVILHVFGMFQLMLICVLYLPLGLWDLDHLVIVNPSGYALRYALPATLIAAVAYCLIYANGLRAPDNGAGFVPANAHTDRRLLNIIEQMAITVGVKPPNVVIMLSPALNAFVYGNPGGPATLAVTRGLVDTLDDDELSGVVAHELILVRNGDMTLMAHHNTAVAIMSFVGNLLPRPKGGDNISGASAKLTRLMASRSAHFIADAEAVCLTHHPAAMVSALGKLRNQSTLSPTGEAFATLMFDGLAEGPSSTHPLVDERIQKLMCYSGSMVGTAGRRKDTRFANPQDAPRTTFGRRQPDLPLEPHVVEKRNLWYEVAPSQRPTAFQRRIQIAISAFLLVSLIWSGEWRQWPSTFGSMFAMTTDGSFQDRLKALK